MAKRGPGPKSPYVTGSNKIERKETRKERAWARVPKEYHTVPSDKYGKPLADLGRTQLEQVRDDHQDPRSPDYNPGGETTVASTRAVSEWREEHRADFAKRHSPEAKETRKNKVAERDERLKDAASDYFSKPENFRKTLDECAAELAKQGPFYRLSAKTIAKKIKGVKRGTVRSARRVAKKQ